MNPWLLLGVSTQLRDGADPAPLHAGVDVLLGALTPRG